MQLHHHVITRGAISLAALALLAWSGCSTSQNPPATSSAGAGSFDGADINHDGKLSSSELSDSFVSQMFVARDANHDGRMTQQEWTGGDSGRLEQFKKRDLDGDGGVTRQEAISYGRQRGVAVQMMKEADKNGDGSLDKTEAEAYYASIENPAH